MADDLEFVAFDIETTGFDSRSEVTVVGFALPMGCRVFCHTDGQRAPKLEQNVQQRVDTHVDVTTHDAERDLLEAVGAFADRRLRDDDLLLVAYNGERWRAGFDLPFIRTRLSINNVQWPFSDLPYADLLPVVRDRFNTNIDGDEHNDLVGAYDVLIGDGLNDLDPFTDSEEAVGAFHDGRDVELVLHNVADILRTRALGTLTQRYCSKSDYSLKSLTPTRAE